MSLQTITGKRVGDTYYKLEHPSGLTVFIYPKENSNSTYAVFGTKYGSVDNQFRRSDEDTVHTVPEGIAHFLEHKLFESEDGDAFARYAKTGASANAYTSFDMTCYLFSCTENVEASLEILLDFVQSPYFTEQTVQKEQGIIGQEIRMYDDDPQWRVMFNYWGLYITHILLKSTLQEPLKVFLILPRNCCINATILFMTCIIWLYVWPAILIKKPY